MRNFEEITIKQVQEGYLSGEFSCEELVKWYLERIEKFNFQGPELRAMITVNPNALEEARRMDEYVKEHHALMGAMHGVPTILKDNFDTKDMETTAGSIALKGWRPPDDAFVTERLRKAGAVFLGKSNLHEFAIWGETISSILGQTLNPYDLTRTPGALQVVQVRLLHPTWDWPALALILSIRSVHLLLLIHWSESARHLALSQELVLFHTR